MGAAVRLILRQGFCATRVDEICREAGVTKGAFFHHFAGKEAIGAAAIESWGRMGCSVYAPAWSDDGSDPLERLERLFEIMSGFTERPGEPCVCVVGMMAQEVAGSNDGLRAACDRELAHWTGEVARLLEEARRLHAPAVDFDAAAVAWYLNSLWQGSMLVAKAHGDPSLIRSNLRMARDQVNQLFGRPPKPEASRRGKPRRRRADGRPPVPGRARTASGRPSS